jgi:hypothetical protein
MQDFLHPGRSVSPLDAHVLKKTAPLIGQSLLSGAWPPIDRRCLVWAVITDSLDRVTLTFGQPSEPLCGTSLFYFILFYLGGDIK